MTLDRVTGSREKLRPTLQILQDFKISDDDDSHLEEVDGLSDQRRVQVRFSPDVVGVLQELLPL